MGSAHRYRLIENLIRERDYYIANVDRSVFLIYLYYRTDDDYVKKVVQFKMLLKKESSNTLNFQWFTNQHPEYAGNYREMLAASGELEILERVDIEHYMAQLN
jgi:hypothetical protein